MIIPYYVSGFTSYARYLINFALETHRSQYGNGLGITLLVSPFFLVAVSCGAQWSDGRPQASAVLPFFFSPLLCLLLVFSGILFHDFF